MRAKNYELNQQRSVLYLAGIKGNRMMKSWIGLSLQEAGWAPLSVLLFSLLLGKVFHAYEIFSGLDKAVHVFGGMAITYFFAVCIFHVQKVAGAIPCSRQLVLALVLSLLAALAWEGIELLGDFTLHLKMNHGMHDTVLDILFGLLGSLILLFFRIDSRPAAPVLDRKG